MKLETFKSRHPEIPISGDGQFLVLACGFARRYAEKSAAIDKKYASCGQQCHGVQHHHGYIIEPDWKPAKWFRDIVEADD